MPGSPPISTTAPATRPPPSTRSNSSRPVGWRGVSRASISDRLRTGLLLASGAYRWAAADGRTTPRFPPACSRHCSAGICPATSGWCRRIRRRHKRFDSWPCQSLPMKWAPRALRASGRSCGPAKPARAARSRRPCRAWAKICHQTKGSAMASRTKMCQLASAFRKSHQIENFGHGYKKLTAGFLQIAHNQAITRNDNPPAFKAVPTPGPGPGAMAKSPRDRWAAFQDAALNRNTTQARRDRRTTGAANAKVKRACALPPGASARVRA